MVSRLDSLAFFAKSDEYLEEFRELLEGETNKNPEVDSLSEDTVLHVAAKSVEDTIGIVEELINAGVNVNVYNTSGFTPLHYTVIYRKHREFDALIRCTILVNCKNVHGVTALHYAVNNEEYKDFEHNFISSGADMWLIDYLFRHRYLIMDSKDDNGETPLMWAIKNRRLDVVNFLLQKGASLFISNVDKATPLHIALSDEYPCPYIISQLIFSGAGLNSEDKHGQTPLDIIIQRDRSMASYQLACICLKLIALKYQLFENDKLKAIPGLLQFLKKCRDEVQRMRTDTIADRLTVLDFLRRSDSKSCFDNPLIQVYKPVIEKLLSGIYPEYFLFILKRIPKSTLSKLLKMICENQPEKVKPTAESFNEMSKENETKRSKLFSLKSIKKSKLFSLLKRITCAKTSKNITPEEKPFLEGTESEMCKDERSSDLFVEVAGIELLHEYLSYSDLFNLIGALSRVKICESMRHSLEDVFYLSDSWTEYSDDYFIRQNVDLDASHQ